MASKFCPSLFPAGEQLWQARDPKWLDTEEHALSDKTQKQLTYWEPEVPNSCSKLSNIIFQIAKNFCLKTQMVLLRDFFPTQSYSSLTIQIIST